MATLYTRVPFPGGIEDGTYKRLVTPAQFQCHDHQIAVVTQPGQRIDLDKERLTLPGNPKIDPGDVPATECRKHLQARSCYRFHCTTLEPRRTLIFHQAFPIPF